MLRAGPSPRKGLAWDVTTGVLGVALLVASVVLLDVLPQKDVPPNEFRVTFDSVPVDLPAQSFDFVEADARSHDFFFEVPDDDVYEIKVQVSFVDDIVASAPDKFRFSIYDPNGEVAEADVSLMNQPARLAANSTTEFEAVTATLTHTKTLTPKPRDAIVTAVDGATARHVEDALQSQHHRLTKGTWRVHVLLDQTGDCENPPVPPGSPEDVTRFAACQQQTSGDSQDPGQDLGNPFTVGVFSYTRFEAHAERFG